MDLVISVGGDGTVLSASHFLGDNIPLVGVNSDPDRAEDKSTTKRTDERRSFGALCMCTALDVEDMLPKVCGVWDLEACQLRPKKFPPSPPPLPLGTWLRGRPLPHGIEQAIHPGSLVLSTVLFERCSVLCR